MVDAIVENVLKERYYQPGEKSWGDVCERVADFIGDNHAEKQAYYNMMRDGIFIPNSPCLMNAGTHKPLMSACFAIGIDDSMESIFEAVKRSAILYKHGAGVGYDFSKLRPAGANVKGTHGIASGVLSFMKVFDSTIDVVKQGGKRRGAAIAILRVDHPEIVEFINCKKKEGDFSNFNISVMLTNEFLEAVQKNEWFDLKHNGTVYKAIPAKDLYNEIIEGMWRNGEPGILFYDTINDANPNKHLGPIEACNPCVTGDTLVLTSTGYVPIVDLVGKQIDVWNGFEWSTVTPYKTSDNEELWEVEFTNGTVIRCTPYHKFPIWTGDSRSGHETRLMLSDCKVGDGITKFTYPVIEGNCELDHAYTNGFYSGDGFYNTEKRWNQTYLYGEKMDLLPYLTGVRYSRDEFDKIAVIFNNGVIRDKTFVPDNTFTLRSRVEWFTGLVDADGSRNCKGGSLSISSVNREFLDTVRLMLSTCGVYSTLSIMKDETVKSMPNGKGGYDNYYCNVSYRLVVSQFNVRKLLSLGMDLKRVDVKDATCAREAQRFIRIKRITPISDCEPVYCLTEEKRHLMVVNGILSTQCGEIPIYVIPKENSGESCNLGSIDVSKLYDGVMQNFRWRDLESIVKSAVRFLNQVMDKNVYPFDEIRVATLATRKIGLGMMGLADLFIKSGVPYGSADSIEIAKKLAEFINDTAIEESCRLSRSIYRPYPAWKGSEWEKKKITIANSVLTCQAPTGTISLFAGCSSGIEPNFGWVYQRSTWVNGNKVTYDMVHPLFEKHFLSYGKPTYENVIIPYVKKNGTIAGCPGVATSDQELFKCAKDVHWKEHVMIQGHIQQHVGNSISKTINCDNSITTSDISDLLFEAHSLGCKGLTIYREGSRSDVVLSKVDNSEKEEEFESNAKDLVNELARNPITELLANSNGRILPKTPRDMFGIVAKRTSGCGKLYISIGEANGGPHTVLIKNKGGCTAMTQTVAELTAAMLRWGIPRWELLRILNGIKCEACIRNPKADGKSCADIIGNVLRLNLPDEEIPPKDDIADDTEGTIIDTNIKTPLKKVESKKVKVPCPDCGEGLIFESGCRSCPSCGYSKCN